MGRLNWSDSVPVRRHLRSSFDTPSVINCLCECLKVNKVYRSWALTLRRLRILSTSGVAGSKPANGQTMVTKFGQTMVTLPQVIKIWQFLAHPFGVRKAVTPTNLKQSFFTFASRANFRGVTLGLLPNHPAPL